MGSIVIVYCNTDEKTVFEQLKSNENQHENNENDKKKGCKSKPSGLVTIMRGFLFVIIIFT